MPLVTYTDSDTEEEDQKPFSFTSFLFGNVSEEGTLESDYLDAEAKQHLNNLNTRSLNCLSNQIQDVTNEVSGTEGSSSSFASEAETSDQEGEEVTLSPTAVDFSEIDEAAAEEDKYDDLPIPVGSLRPLRVAEGSPDPLPVNGPEISLEPPEPLRDQQSTDENPTSISSQNLAVLESVQNIFRKNLDVAKSDGPERRSLSPSRTAVSPGEPRIEASSDDGAKKSLNTPLASVLPPELSGININDIYPDFKPDVTLRFSRLFGPGRPSSLPKRWVNYRDKFDGASSVAQVESSEGEETDDEDDEAELERLSNEFWPIEMPRAPLKLPGAVIVSDVTHEPLAATAVVEPEKPTRLNSSVIPPWRYGPAQHWYDVLNVDPTGENFDYGSHARKKDARATSSASSNGLSKGSLKLEVNDESFLMVSLTNWEQNIIWDGTSVKRDVEKLLAEKRTEAGWIPNTTYRTAAAFLSHGKSGSQPPVLDLKNDSMFPAENEELVNGIWEKHIIWDADNIENLPEPSILTLDPNDPNIIIGMPDEEEYETMTQEPVMSQEKQKKDMYKRSRMVMSKAGMLNEPDSPKPLEEPKNQLRDPFNLSFDEYYVVKADEGNLKTTTGAVAIQHSIPAVELYQSFFPTNFNLFKLRQFHRNALKKFSNGLIIQSGPHPVESLNKTIKKREKQRAQELTASGGGEMFFMRIPEDLSTCDGELILAEYSEEYPPLVNQIGMATRIKNYYKRKPGKNEEDIPKFEHGEPTLAHTSPFLGALDPGQCVRAFENNMYRAPIYEHNLPATDFLVIRTRNHYYIRDIKILFSVGQQCPLIEVPAPNSKKATNFARDFLQVHIYRLFWKSTEDIKRIKTEDVKKMFALHSESTVRKRLKLCAVFNRSGVDSHWWSLKSDFRLPTEEEIRAIVTPEDYCAFYSMRSAEQRLKDAGYGEKLILATEDDGDEEMQSKMDDEIKAAPWNTTRAFIAAMKNKCILQLTGDADPTGRGEGFSYVRVPNKIQEKDGPQPVKRTVTGTDADLRKLSLNNAKQLLRKYGCHDDQIKKLTRWEIIDLVRTLGTKQARSGAEEAMSKFARGNRFSAAEQQENYKKECQRIFDLQNQLLSSREVVSSEESSEEDGDSDLEEAGRNLDSFIQSQKSTERLLFEKEEEERKELKKLLNQEEADAKMAQKKKLTKKKSAAGVVEEPVDDVPPPPVRKLKIVRTFRDAEGREYDRTEYVSRAALIDAYVRIRTQTDENFIRQFAALDSEKKEQIRKEKRRLQEQLRRIKRIESDNPSPETTPKKKPKKEQPKVRCGACGGVGHMRTNKALCPMAGEIINVAMTKEQEDAQLGSAIEDSGLVRVEGAKITLKKEVLNQTEQIRRQSLIVKIPKHMAIENPDDRLKEKMSKKERREMEKMEKDLSMQVVDRKKKRKGLEMLPDYLEKPRLSTARRRVDPVISLGSILEEILNEIRDLPGCEPFRTPVSLKSCPDYLQYVETPMDLSTMRVKLNNSKFKSREEFLSDVNQIVQNCAAYNGPNSALTTNAKKMLETCLLRFGEGEEKFKKLEKLINPLLDDDDQVALSYLLQQIITNKMKNVDGSSVFHTPVNRKSVKDYYEIIATPMDLDTMLTKAKSHKYQTSKQFLTDAELIYSNCVQYNGEDSAYSRTAADLTALAKEAIREEAERVAGLETAIRATQDAAMEAAETESVGTAASESEPRSRRRRGESSRFPSIGDVEESTRASGALSDIGDDEVMGDIAPSPSASVTGDQEMSEVGRDTPLPPEEPPSESEFNDEETASRTNDVPSPPMRKQQVRLSMVNTYYEDARTGYEDESDHGDDKTGDDNKAEDSEKAPVGSPAPKPAGLAALAKDLHVSDDSDDEKEDKEKSPSKSATNEAEEEDDGLWF